jgi:cell wall-associated NlpC family hydrolase
MIIKTGLKHLGRPYLFNAPPFQTDYFDCSSFIQYIFGVNGIKLPRNSRQQFRVGRSLSHAIKKGDLLFFTTKMRMHKVGIEKVGHVGLYLGNGKMLHTSRGDKMVTITKLDDYWKSVFLGAKRVI